MVDRKKPWTYILRVAVLIGLLVGVNSLSAANFPAGDVPEETKAGTDVLKETKDDKNVPVVIAEEPVDDDIVIAGESGFRNPFQVEKFSTKEDRDNGRFKRETELWGKPYRFNRSAHVSKPPIGNNAHEVIVPAANRSSKWIDLMNSINVPNHQADDDDGKWRFEFQPYIWLTLRAKGSLPVDPPAGGGGDGVNVDIDLGPKELFSVDQLFSASGRFEAWRDRFGVIVDVFYLGVGVNAETTFLRQTIGAQVDADTVTFDGLVSYRFGGEHPFRNNSNSASTDEKKGWVEPYGGIRIRSIKLATSLSTGSTFDNTNSWVEPVVGVTAGMPISKKVAFDFRTDYSGFGIEKASNYTYNILAGIDWRLCKKGSLKLAYRRYGTKFERVGRNGRPRALDITTDGLWLSFALRF